MRSVVLLCLLAACAPSREYGTTTTTAAVIRHPRPRPTRAAEQPKREAPPTQVARPAHEATTTRATATVVATEMALPMLVVVPPTPETATLSRVLPPVETGGELPGTLQVLATLHGPMGIGAPLSAVVPAATPMPRRFPFFWLFPFFPFGLARAGGP